MSENEREDRFLKQVKKTLDEGTHNLDPKIQSRLTQIRYTAMGSQSSRWIPEWMNQPTTQWASVACAILLIVLFFGNPGNPQLKPGLEDIDLLASEDVLELYEELEFYAWLAEENVDAS